MNQAAELIGTARADIGMSTGELAREVGLPVGMIEAYEDGSAAPTRYLLTAVLTAARLRPAIALGVLAASIRAEAAHRKLTNVRVIGSAARGEDCETSAVELLVSTTPGASLFDLGGFAAAVEALTGFDVEVLTDDDTDDHLAHLAADALVL
jgi:predicted nucleotidyltransferase